MGTKTKKQDKQKPMHPLDKEMLRVLSQIKIEVTPAQIADAVGIHPATAQKRLKELIKKDLVQYRPKGNRTYCSVNVEKLKKILKKELSWK